MDNLPKSYVNQPENGIPILSWYDDKKDRELDTLFPLLIMLSKVGDVRKYITKMVKKDKIDYDILYSLFEKKAEFQNFLRKIVEIKGCGVLSPKRQAKSPIESANSRSNKENRPVTANKPHSPPNKYPISHNYRRKRDRPKKMIKKNSYESPKKKKPNKKTIITLEENYSQSKTYQKGNLDSVKREARHKDSTLLPTPSKTNSSFNTSSTKKSKKRLK